MGGSLDWELAAGGCGQHELQPAGGSGQQKVEMLFHYCLLCPLLTAWLLLLL
jgi:hypothetical protein